MRKEVKKEFDNILDCMTGADGGTSFINLRSFLEEMDGQAKNGKASAEELIKIMTRFSRLIDISNGKL